MSNSDAPVDVAPVPRPVRKRSAGKTAAPPDTAGDDSRDPLPSMPPVAHAATVPRSADYLRLAKLIRTGCEVHLPSLGDTVLRMQLTEDKAGRFADPVVLTGSAIEIQFSDGTRLLRALTGIDLGSHADNGQAHWEWLQAALIGRLGVTPFGVIDRLSRTGKPGATGSLVMHVTLRSALHAFSIMARATATTWINVLSAGQWQIDQRPESDFFSMSYQAPIRIARHAMPAEGLQTIVAGDIFLPSSPRFSCSGEGTIWFGDTAVGVRHAAPGLLTIMSMEGKVKLDNTGEGGANEDGDPRALAESEAVDDQDGQLATQTIAVDFELGRMAMSVGAARALGVGSSIALDGGSPASIAIVANGRLHGRGEVVDVRGQLGIRVTQWHGVS